MSEKIRVVHYINQFYAGIGGEEQAGIGISTKQGPVGPGVLLQADLGDRYEVTETIICGDNYIAEHTPEAAARIAELVREAGAQLFVAGPGFNAGRYGIGCGAATAEVTEKLRIPAVTALYSENPGTDLYQDRCYILMTENNALSMRRVMGGIAAFADRLVRGEPIGDGAAEHFHGSGPAIEIHYEIPAAKRGIDLLLKKFRGEPFRTEVRMPGHENIPVPVLKKPLGEAVIAVVTDGGLVPAGNPDHLPVTNSREYRRYDYRNPDRMDPEDFEVRHQGYNNFFVQQDPNRLVPLDALRVLCGEHRIGGIFGAFYTTAGVMTSMENGKKFGEGIAADLLRNQVDAVLLTSTWGTSSRCGAVMTKEIERAGIPIVHVTNLTKISEGIGTHRIFRGNSVLHVFGNPALPAAQEFAYRKNLVEQALSMLTREPPEGQYSLICG